MILENKNAVVYGAGGSLGGAVSRAFAKAGARVFLTGHRQPSVQQVAAEIRAGGGNAEVAIVDGYDAEAVAAHLQDVVRMAGHVDISFNAVDIPVIQNVPLLDIPTEDIVRPVERTVRTRIITAKAAAKLMKDQGSGVILFLTATPGGIGYPYTGGFSAANASIETLSTNLAAELGIYGIRVVTVRSGGSPDSAVFQQAIAAHPAEMQDILRGMEDDTMLKQLPLMGDIANTAVFLVSDLAGKITGVTVDVTCGTTAGLNHRVRLPTFGANFGGS